MFLVALTMRLVVSFVVCSDYLNPARNYWSFGCEAGQVASSLYHGHGFAAPFFVPSGPTALLPPVYPYLMFACMKLFGGYTAASAMAILALNSLFAALTVIPVFCLGWRTFGERTARIAGWTWALFPYSIYLSAGRMWVDTLACLTASLMLLQTIRLTERRSTCDWLLWGAILGIGALISPVLLGPLPFLAVWLIARRRKAGLRWIFPMLVSALVCLTLVAPWTIRNYNTFHRLVPVRDGFWLEVHEGNCGDTSDVQPDSSHPNTSAAEFAQWVSLGEIGYLDAKKVEAQAFIREHPAYCAWVTLRRFAYTWTGFWTLDRRFLANEPFHIPNVLFTTILTALMLLGLAYGWRSSARKALIPFVLELLTFPVVFYLTHPSMDYRHPLDPIIVILACYGVVEWLRRRNAGKGERVDNSSRGVLPPHP